MPEKRTAANIFADFGKEGNEKAASIPARTVE
jgi:hypothetical protein